MKPDRIAGEIYAPPIRFKRAVAKSFGAATFTSTETSSLKEADWPDVAYRIYLRFWSGERDIQGPVDLRKVNSPRARRKRERKRERENLVDDPMK